MIEPVTLTPKKAKSETPIVVFEPLHNDAPEAPVLSRRAADFAKRFAEIEDIQSRI